MMISVFFVQFCSYNNNDLILANTNIDLYANNDNCGNYPPIENSPYILPFPAGTAYIMYQGNCQKFSHKDGQRYAYDFAMPLGTTITAARAGTVMATESRYPDYIIYKGKPVAKNRRAKGNLVIIKHDDGTLGTYLHIKQNGVSVSAGQYVEQGQEIALSGNSGYTTGPHLHFEVRSDDGGYTTIPVVFNNSSPRHSGALITGETYTALDISNTRNNSSVAVFRKGYNYLKSFNFSDFLSSNSTTSFK